MSTFGFSRIEISFKDEMPKAFESEHNMLDNIDSQLEVHDFESSGLSVWFELSSSRLQNLAHQLNQVLKYISDNKYPVIDIRASGYEESDYGTFSYDGSCGDELEEYLD